jgi:hypothetical protein
MPNAGVTLPLPSIPGSEVPGVRLVAVYSPEVGLVLAQEGGKTREEAAPTAEKRAQAKQEAELSVAPPLLR